MQALVIHCKGKTDQILFFLTNLNQMFGIFKMCKEGDAAYSREMGHEGRQLGPPAMALQCQQIFCLSVLIL